VRWKEYRNNAREHPFVKKVVGGMANASIKKDNRLSRVL
jgi:hypothetical protein